MDSRAKRNNYNFYRYFSNFTLIVNWKNHHRHNLTDEKNIVGTSLVFLVFTGKQIEKERKREREKHKTREKMRVTGVRENISAEYFSFVLKLKERQLARGLGWKDIPDYVSTGRARARNSRGMSTNFGAQRNWNKIVPRISVKCTFIHVITIRISAKFLKLEKYHLIFSDDLDLISSYILIAKNSPLLTLNKSLNTNESEKLSKNYAIKINQ